LKKNKKPNMLDIQNDICRSRHQGRIEIPNYYS